MLILFFHQPNGERARQYESMKATHPLGYTPIKLSLWILLIMITFPGLTLEAREYTIQKDETLYSIAMRFGVDIQRLLEINAIDNPRLVHAGRVITIPGEEELAPAAAEEKIYQVKEGDTYFSISQRFHLAVDDLLQMNQRESDALLFPGEKLVVGKKGASKTAVPEDSDSHLTDPPVPQQQEKTPTPVSPPRFPLEGLLVESDDSMGGVVIQALRETPVYTLQEGVIVWSGPFKGYGKVILLEDLRGRIHIYGGMSHFEKFTGDNLTQGDILGRVEAESFFRYAVFSGNNPLTVSLSQFEMWGAEK